MGFFLIGATSGALTFDAAPSFEDPRDQDAGNPRVERGRRRLVRAPMLRVGRLAAAFLLAAAAVLPVAPVAAQDVAPAAPTGFAVAPGSIKAKLSWDDPPAGVIRHEVRFRADTAAFPAWQRIPDSDSDGDNASGYILSGLTADTDYDFELRAVNGGAGDAATVAATTLPPFTARFNTENKYHTGGPFTIEVEFTAGVEKEVLRRGVFFGNSSSQDVAEQDERPELWHFVPHPRSRTRDVTINIPRATSCGTGKICSTLGEPLTNALVRSVPYRPTVSLKLTPAEISEDGGASMVTASLDKTWHEAVTVVVSASPVSPATSSDFALGSNTTLTIRAGARTSTGDVTITAANNDVAAPDKQVKVSGMVTAPDYVPAPAERTLTILDDDAGLAAPTGFAVSAGSTKAKLSWDEPSDGAVITAHEVRYRAGDDALPDTWETIPNSAPGQANEKGYTVTGLSPGTAYDFELRAATGSVSSSAASASATTQAAFTARFETIPATHDGSSFSVRIGFSADIASLDAVEQGVQLTGARNTGVDRVDGRSDLFDYAVIPSGEAGVTITLPVSSGCSSNRGICNTFDEPLAAELAQTIGFFGVPSGRKLVGNVTKALSNGALPVDPSSGFVFAQSFRTGTNETGYKLDEIGIHFSDAGVGDMAVVSLLSATDDGEPGSVLFPLTGRGGLTNGRLTYFSAPPGALLAKETPYYLQVTGFGSSMFNVRILGDADETAEDGNSLAGWSIGDDLREKTVSTSWITTPKVMQLRVNGRVLGTAPSVFLGLEPAAVAENGAAATVTATVSPASDTAFTVTVSAAPVDPAMASDFRLSTNTTLSFAANATKSTGIVTVTAVDNDVKAADKQVTVSGSVTGNDSIPDPNDVTLLILDDERAAVSLVLTPRAIAENGGTSTVTATVSSASDTAFDVTVSASPVDPATASDFSLSTNTTLGFAANATQSTGIVTVTAVNNDDQTENRQVTVSGSVSAAGIVAPAARRLTILDAGAPTFTAWFDEIPERHNGVTAFTVRIHFSADISTVRTLEQGVQLSVDLTGNTVTRVDGRSDLWDYTATPKSNDDVVITLPSPSGCNTDADICSSSNVPLTTALVGRIAGPASIDPSDEPREPSPPTNFWADALDGAVRLRWRAPIFDGGSPITGHEFRSRELYIGTPSWTAWTSIPESTPGGPNGESFTVTEGMQNDQAYEFQLRARNSLGWTFATPRTDEATPVAGQLPIDYSLTPSPPDPAVATHSRAVYTVTFEGQWTTEATPGGVPSGAHFSRLVGGVHNADVVFVEDEIRTASPGIESMAETGGTTTLKAEIAAAGDNHLSVLEGANNSILATASESLTGVTLTTDHPRVTLLTMVAPSPDWFVGVSGLSMLDNLGGWRESRTVELHPFDAGTEEGAEFSLTNDGTDPHERIGSLLGKGKFSAEPIATLTFQRTAVVTVPAAPTDLTATAGTGQVELAWTMGGDGGSAIAKHQYRYRTGPSYPENWTDIPDSAADEDNAASFTVVNLTIGLAHTFQVRAVNELGEGPAATTAALALSLDAIAGDDTVNIAEKAAGFAISGATGSEAGATVTVTVGGTELTATSAAGGAWSVDVPADAAYITGTSVTVTVSASKTGFTSPSDVTRTLAVDLTAPSASYTAPSSLQVGVAVSAMTPSTTDTDIASYSVTGLPPGLGIDAGTGVVSGTPDTADANTASATVTVKDTAGNTVDVSITFPAVAKEAQTLTGFAYSSASVTFGGTAPTVTAPGGVQTTLSYSATPTAVCTVDASTGALTLVGVGACEITATAAPNDDYNEATAAFTVTVQAVEVLALSLDTIAGDDRVNIAEKAAGFAISGDTGSEAGVTVSVTIGTESPLTATSGSGGAWSVDVPADAAYITGTSVTVTVSASKTGYTPPSDVTRALAVDLTAPSATYTPPSSLQVGVAIGAMTPSTTATDIASYSATGLPSGLGIDTGTGVISGTPDTADASTASATVTVKDTAGNAADASITFPAVAKADQTLTGFAYSSASVTFGGTAPTVTAPGGVQTTLSYSATPTAVCTVDASTGALTLVGVGACEITATAAPNDDYNEATAAFTVTVQAVEVLALSLDTIAGDDRVNIAEKAAGFAISGDTGSEAGVTVSVTIGTESPLTATSGSGGAWSVDVPADAAYITGTSVTVTVSASKTGYTPPSDVTRALAVDLTAPSATYTPPSSLQVGVAIGAMTPSTTATDIAEYSATGLPSGLGIDSTTGAISGTPDTADANTADATVTVTDTAGNPATVPITFPAVAKGAQTLTGFAYSPATVTYGDTAPAVTAPSGVQTTLSYSATPTTVCTVDASTGALTLVGVGACEITATAASSADYNEATAAFTVTVQAAGALALNLDTIAGDDTVNIAEKAAGFMISGDTGSEAGVSVTVTVGGTELTATSAAAGAWSVDVPANATYITGASVTVTVSASKTGYTPPSDVTRALAVDLTAPSASYTPPSTLKVGVAIGAMTPSTIATDIASYSATGLPSGLGIDTTTGVISGTPDTADPNTASAAVTVKDTAGNTVDVSITFPAVAKGAQTLTGFAYSSASVAFGGTAPAVTAPGGVQTTLSYSATPSDVCTVNSSTGALTLEEVGSCEITATAASSANYNEATAAFTVTVQAAGALALNLDTIAGDDTVNIAEKAAGFAISGDTGTESGVSVTVTVGSTPLTATSAAAGAWSVGVPANATYITGASVTVTVSASKTGYTPPSDVTRALAVDLTAPSASYTPPSTLKVGVAIGAMTPSTTATDIASYSATGLPSGLGIDTGAGVIGGTPDTADTNTASATVTVKDTAGNSVDVSITFPAVAKGAQTLTGFAYSSASVAFGGTAPAVTAPGGVQTTLSYSATPTTVCTVDASTGALTLMGVGACNITATAAGAANYNEATAAFTVTVQAAGALALNLDAIATDNTVNIAEKAAGFTISGDTGSEAGVSVTVTVGGMELTATSAAAGAWSVGVPANATYITGASVTVTVSASKTGYTPPSDVTRALAVDLTAPSASYTPPSTLKVGVVVSAMTPSTTDTDIAEYSATGLPPGLGIDSTTGAISGTPDTADANTADATVTVTDTAGNAADASITFPAVAKGAQTLTGFVYSSASVTFGGTAPTVTAPSGVQTTLSYSATPSDVCTVNSSTGALTLEEVGSCEITATAASSANYNEATAAFTVTVAAAGALALNLDTIAGDDTVNIAEKAAGFAISGDTGSEEGVSVTVTVGGTELTATSAAAGAWSVDVPANATYITGASVTVTVSASKTGFTSPSDVMRTLAVDLTAPTASYTAPGTLKVGVAVSAMTPSTTDTDIASYSATGLPSGLGIDTGTGVISGTPDAADANTADATVTVTDTAGNPATVSITFPAVAKGAQTLTGFAYSSASVAFGGTAPTVTAPSGVQTTLSYSATPSDVCTVDSSTGALTLAGVGSCEITATAASSANYNEATAAFTVTVQAAGALALNLDTIAGDDTVNSAEKAAGFMISGDTGTESGVSVTVTVGSTPVTATSDSGGAWSVAVPADAAYLTGTSVAVTVSASKTGYTPPSDVTRTLAVDLTAPSATYTAPSSLQVGVAIGAMTPSTTATDIASYSATGLPSGLGIDAGTGVVSGTPDTADPNTASAAVTVTDTAGNSVDVSITFPAVAKGAQTLTGFAYSSASVAFGGTAPAVTAPGGVQTTLSYSATPTTVCTVDASTGALTLMGVGACNITATAAGAANYNEATAAFTVTVAAAGALALNLDTIAGDDTVNIAEKAAGFTISGDTGTESGVSVTVTVGSTPLTATSAAAGAWSVGVPANATYITGASVTVTVSASKTGYTPPSDVTRTLAVDLTAPSATYTAPSSLQVGVAIGAMTPSTTATDIASYSATGLPSGLGIDAGTGVVSGTSDTADPNTASAAVTVTDTAGNTVDVSITFPAVAKGAQTLTGFAYSSASVAFSGTAPAVTAPGGVQTTLSYSATPTHGVHGGLVHGRLDARGGGRLRDHRHRGVERQLQRGHRGVHRHGAGGRRPGAEPRHDRHRQHGEHRREGRRVRDQRRHRLGGGGVGDGDGRRDGVDRDLGRRRRLVGGRAGERGLPHRRQRGGDGERLEDRAHLPRRRDAHAGGGPDRPGGELHGAGLAAGGGGHRRHDAEHHRHRHRRIQRHGPAAGAGHRHRHRSHRRDAGHRRPQHRQRGGDGDRHRRQHRGRVDHLPGGGQGSPDADGVRLQLRLGHLQRDRPGGDGAGRGPDHPVVLGHALGRVHGRLVHGRPDARGGGRLQHHRHRGRHRQLQRGHRGVHRHGAGGRRPGAKPRRDRHRQHGEHRREGRRVHDLGRHRLGGGGVGERHHRYGVAADGDLGRRRRLVGGRARERGLPHRRQRGGDGERLEDRAHLPRRRDAHAGGGPDRPGGELHGAEHAAGGGGHRRHDAEHHRHRHRRIQRHGPAAGAGHRHRHRSHRRDAGHRRPQHRQRGGDGDRHRRQHRGRVDHLPGGGQGSPDADGVRLQLRLGHLQRDRPGGDGAGRGPDHPVVLGHALGRVHGRLVHGRPDARGGGRLQHHRHRGRHRQLQRGHRGVHRHGAGGRRPGAKPRRDRHRQHGEHRREGRRVHDLGRHRLGGGGVGDGDGRRDGVDRDLGRRRRLVGGRAGERGLHHRRQRGGDGERLEDRAHLPQRRDAHAGGGPDRPGGELHGAEHAAGGGGHRRHDAEHHRHRHRRIQRHGAAVGAGHRHRHRGHQRDAGRGRREHRRRHGDGDRPRRQPRHRVDHLPGGGQRRHRGAGRAGRAGCAVGVGGVGDEPDRDLDRAGAQRRPGHHGLQRGVPGEYGHHVG